jgi:hypothetical protein
MQMAKIVERRQLYVYADWQGLAQGPQLMGTLSAVPVRGKEVFSFAYAPQWLALPQAQALDPALQLFTGPQYLPEDQPNFGLFLDSAPDRWGRLLMCRREAALARQEDRRERPLLESDYLLGVFDGYRMGCASKLTPVGLFSTIIGPWRPRRGRRCGSWNSPACNWSGLMRRRTRIISSGCLCWWHPALRWAGPGPRPAW